MNYFQFPELVLLFGISSTRRVFLLLFLPGMAFWWQASFLLVLHDVHFSVPPPLTLRVSDTMMVLLHPLSPVESHSLRKLFVYQAVSLTRLLSP